MKATIKFFSLSVFFICILPMFQMCSDDTILKNQLQDEVIVDPSMNSEILQQKNDSLKRNNQSQKSSRLKELKKEYTINAYEFGFLGYQDFELEDFKDWTFYPIFCFTISIFSFLIVFISAIKENFSRVFKLSSLNLLLIIGAMLIFIFKEGIEIIDQIRYGYYLLIVNLMVLILLSKMQLKKNNV